MKYKVKVTFKDGTVRIEAFDNEAHVYTFINYITRNLKDYILKTELLNEVENEN